MPTYKLTKKNSFTHLPTCILPSFSQNTSQSLLQKKFWACVGLISFGKYKQKVVLLVIYLFNYDSSRSTFFIWHLMFSWVQFLSNEFKFFVSWKVKVTRTSLFLFCVLILTFLYKNLIVLHHDDDNFLFYFDMCIKFPLSTIISGIKKS